MTWDDLLTTPFGATSVELDEKRWAQLSDRFYEAEGQVLEVLVSDRTGAFLRGLARTHNIPDDDVPKLATSVLYVALGEWPLANLAAGLSSTMGLPNDKAQKVAAEIEKELFAPITLELNTFLEEQRQPKAAEQAQQAGATNVVDLKKHSSQNTPLRPKGFAGQAEHKQFPKPSLQTGKGPPLPRPGEFNK